MKKQAPGERLPPEKTGALTPALLELCAEILT
jgi:hypothetical protein